MRWLSMSVLAGVCAVLACVAAAQQQHADAGLLQDAGTNAAKVQPADVVLINGKIVTVDDAIGTVQAVAIVGEKIIEVGTSNQLLHHIGDDTQVIDLDGRLAIPGFIEGHGHFTGIGEAKMNLDLLHVRSWQEVIDMVAEAVRKAKPGEWITGRGWHQEKWDTPPDGAVEGFPTHWSLSDISPDNPVVLRHASGHASFANKRAMDESGISGTTQDPPGGEILRDESGQPIGIFRQNAQGLIRAESRSISRRAQFERMDRAIDLAVQECLSNGVTSFQDAGLTYPVIDRLRSRAENHTLDVRLWVMIRTGIDATEQHAAEYAKIRRVGGDRLTVGGIKFAIDGALGSRGAWLLEPYADSPESTGFNTTPIETLERGAKVAIESGLQLCIHAIGDRANREVLDIYEDAFATLPEEKTGHDLRWRIEHAQHLHPDDVPRFGEMGVIASMQGVHCTSDGPWVYKRLGRDRAESGAYVWQDLMDSGAVVTNGTDAPVEDINPLVSFHSTVTRKLNDGSIFFDKQRMSRIEALKSYTINCAYAAFEDDIKGTLTPGKLADIVILSDDIMTIPAEAIPSVKVDMTIVGGRVVYERDTSG